MAIRTGITPTQWAEEGEQTIATAVELLTASRPAEDTDTGREAPAGWELHTG